ncbi:glycosyltransferase 87 family protein [Streptomyces lasalocidi]
MPTIYPPVAEGWFLAVHTLSPPGTRHKPLQVGGAVLVFGTTIALLAVLRRRGDPQRAPARAALWGWCPAVPFEAVNNAHIDTLGVLLTVLALGTARAGARRGALLGAAIAVKLLPVLALPGALSGQRSARRIASVTAAALGAVALSYLPYVLASGTSVLGYLPGYLNEEGYEPGSVRRFALLRLILPDSAAGIAAVVLLALTALFVWWRGDPARPWSGALLVTGTALLLFSPNYPWYSLLVIALAALDGRWEWLAVTAAGTVLYLAGRLLPGFPLQAWAYGAAALAVALGACLRGMKPTQPLPTGREALGRAGAKQLDRPGPATPSASPLRSPNAPRRHHWNRGDAGRAARLRTAGDGLWLLRRLAEEARLRPAGRPAATPGA